MRHQNGRARLGEASRAVLVLSIPTPRQPQLERETTADDENTYLKQSREPEERERVETLDANLVWSSLVYAPRQAVSTKEVSYFYLVRDERDGRFDVVQEVVARATAALSRRQWRQIAWHEPHNASS